MQAQFDFDRAEQLGMVEHWVPPRVPGLSAAAMKGVLRAIDSFGRGRDAWPSEATLSATSGLGLRTVKRAVKALGALSILIIERRGRDTVNHYRIVWNELALRCGERSANLPSERSAMVSERSAMVSERSATMALHEVPPWHPKRQRNDKETTTTEVVVVLKALARGEKAIQAARARGLSDREICELYRIWCELPYQERIPGKLYNWLVYEGSYRPPAPSKPEPVYGRADKMSREQVASESLRMKIVRAGRAAGADEEVIARRLAEAGV